MIWSGWNLSRTIVLLDGLAFLMIFIQVTMFHYRQNFRSIFMWLPVIAGPIIGFFEILLVLINTSTFVWLVNLLLWLGVFGGLLGFIFHYQGVGQRVDGFVMRNFLVGPPVILPLMFSALGVVGLFAIYWR